MEIHHCIHCGTEAQANWRFCRRCGTGLADLEQVTRVAQCSNCATGLADGWRFCPNCGTSTDSAAPREGLSADEVADLIATPEPDTTAPLTAETEVAGEAPLGMEPGPEPVEAADATLQDLEAEDALEEPEPELLIEPEISKPQVSFDPADRDLDESGITTASLDEPVPPVGDLDFPPEAPAPPDPGLTVAEIEARLAADRPPPPDGDFPETMRSELIDDEVVLSDFESASAAEGLAEAPGPHESFELHGAAASEPAAGDVVDIPEVDETPAVIIPPARDRDRPDVRTELPKPMDSKTRPATEVPKPIEPRQGSTWTPTTPEKTAPPDGELAPTDTIFEDPGIFGQSLQLALLATAAISVAMIVAHIVLNNRLTNYARNGESVPRIQSVENIIGTWLRPALIVALLLTYLLTVIWSRRVVANLAVFEKPVPETALWMWAIPLVNFLVVRQHLDNAWKGSDVLLKDDPEWRSTPGNWWTLAFAVLALATVAVLFFGSFMVDIGTDEGAIDSNSYLMIGYALLAASLLCLVRSIGAVIERQHNRARRFV